MIQWPAVIKFHGDDELLYVRNQQEWNADPDLYAHRYEDEDRLMDGAGKLYTLPFDTESSQTQIIATSDHCSVEEFCQLLKAHLLCLQQCCLPKFHIGTYAEGMQMLKADKG